MSDEKSSSKPKIKLSYFPIRARGEVARMILAEGGLEYEDNRIEFADWGKLKSTTPFGQLPVLEWDGVEIAQSSAIERFLSRKAGLLGSNDFEAAQIDSIHEALADTSSKFVDVVQAGIGSGSDKEKAAWKALWEQVDKYSGFLTKVLKANNKGEGYFVGNNVSYADLQFYVLWEEFYNHNKKVFGDYALLEALFVRVSKRERIAKWLATRPPSRSPIRNKLKLTYFNGRGRAETSRLLLAEAGVAYEDERLDGKEQWPKVKDSTPYGQLPVLWVDSTPIAQSHSIERFIARKTGLLGNSDLAAGQVDSVGEALLDAAAGLMKARYNKDEDAKKKAIAEYFKSEWPKWSAALEKVLAANNSGKGFFVGNFVTLADIAFFGLADTLVNIDGGKDALSASSLLWGLYERVGKRDRIAAWIKKRPQTDF